MTWHSEATRNKNNYHRCASGKLVYSNHRVAIKVADLMRGRDGEDVHVYRCPECGRFHVGHDRFSRRVTADA